MDTKEAKGSNQSLVKVTNQHLIIKEIRDNKKLSRSDLAKKLALSNPSVSKHVDNLIDKGLLVETGSVVTDVGRRPIMLEFNGRFGCVAVIDLSSKDARICVSDLNGNKIEYSRVEGGRFITAETLENIIETLHDMIDSIGSRCGALLGICIGAPGVIEPTTGRINWSYRIQDYASLDLCEMFGEEFGVPVIVKNDINLAVVGERTYGSGVNIRNLLLLSLDVGLGMGLILDGRLYEGVRGVACDIGVMLPPSDFVPEIGKAESTGDYVPHMLERIMSTFKITEMVRSEFSDGRDTVMRDWVSKGEDLTFDDVVKAYGMGDPMVGLIIKRYAKQVAILMKNLASILDVEVILLGGAVARLGTSFLNEVINIFTILPGYSTAEIKLSTLYDTAVIFGGIETTVQAAVDAIIDK